MDIFQNHSKKSVPVFVCVCAQVMERVTVVSVCVMRDGQANIATAAQAHTPVSQRMGQSAAAVESVYVGSASVLFPELQGISVRSALHVEMSVAQPGIYTYFFFYIENTVLQESKYICLSVIMCL